MMTRILVFLVLILISSQAKADWQFTKWGMSEDQVRSAASAHGLAITEIPESERADKSVKGMVALLQAQYTEGSFRLLRCSSSMPARSD
jgi:hypothetical protein